MYKRINSNSIQEFFGYSAEVKPHSPEVSVDDTFYEMDTRRSFYFDGTEWVENKNATYKDLKDYAKKEEIPALDGMVHKEEFDELVKVTNGLSIVSDSFEQSPSQIIHLFADVSGTRVGIVHSIKNDVCSFSGTSKGGFFLFTTEKLSAGTYTISADQFTGTGQFVVGTAESINDSAKFICAFPENGKLIKTITLDKDCYLRFALYNNVSIDLSFRIWANKGTLSLPYRSSSLDLKEESLPNSVKVLIADQPVFMSIQDFNTRDEDMMNNNSINILY